MGTIETLAVGLATAAILAIAIASVEGKRRLTRQQVRIDEQERSAQRNHRLNRR